MPAITSQLWPLVIVGKGSSAAFYASTVDLRDYPSLLAIGDGDAWSAAVRGHHGNATDPTKFINHPHYLIHHFQKTLPEFSEAKVDRLEWANLNKQVLVNCKVQLHEGHVELVSEVDNVPEQFRGDQTTVSGFEILLRDGTKVYAYKVVMAAGAGGHRVPDEIADAKKICPTQVLDLDEFARLPEQRLNKDKTIFVYGPNAAIDAVQKAVHYKCKIIWLLKQGQTPPILDTQPEVKEALRVNPGIIVRYTTFRIIGKTGPDQISVSIDGRITQGHYFAYGMGQTGDPLDAIDGKIKSKLQPIFDKNQYMGDKEGTILGYEAKGTGLKTGFEVVGAMSAQVGRAILKDQKENLQKYIKTLRESYAITFADNCKGLHPLKSPLLESLDILAKKSHAELSQQLRAEVTAIKSKAGIAIGGNTQLSAQLDLLVNVILRYHALINYQSLLNQQTQNMPKGAVADAGQLTSISGAMAAKHTFTPAYIGNQSYTGNENKKSTEWVDVQQTPGEVNFSKDNATTLQLGLSIKYPFISDNDLNTWINNHIQKLKNSGVGYVNNGQFDAELSLLNQQVLNKLRGY